MAIAALAVAAMLAGGSPPPKPLSPAAIRALVAQVKAQAALPPNDPASGREGYLARCAVCHARPGEPAGSAASELRVPPAQLECDPDLLAGRFRELLARLERPRGRMHVDRSHPELPAIVRYLCGSPAPPAPPRPRQSGADQPACDRCHARTGEEILDEAGCANCHPSVTTRRPGRFAPDLTGVGNRFTAVYLRRFLASPYNRRQHGHPPSRFSRMPDFALDATAVADLAAWLGASTLDLPSAARPADAERPALQVRGRALVDQHGCLDCHRIGREGGRMGPDLTGVGNALERDYLHAWLAGPRRIKPDTAMPDPELAADDRIAVASYLESLRAPSLDDVHPRGGHDAAVAPTGSIGRGMARFAELGCASCHPMTGVTAPAPSAPALDTLGLRLRRGWMVDYLDAPTAVRRGATHTARMPRFRLTAPERLAVADALATRAGRLDPTLASWPGGGHADRGAERYRALDCARCHGPAGTAPVLPAARLEPAYAYHALRDPARLLAGCAHIGSAPDEAADLARFVCDPPPEPNRAAQPRPPINSHSEGDPR